jgi:GT2 family glycosyltransferase
VNRNRTAGVIATFNHEKFVAESITSLASQVDEIVVIDDCSSDGTAGILKSLNVPNMKLVLHEKNKGVSASYNEAVGMSRADLIVIQGGDDVSLPGRVHQHINSLNRGETILSFSQPKVIDSVGQALPKEAAPEFFPSVEKAGFFEHLYFVGNFICAPSVALRKVDFISFGGFNPANSYLQDYELWLKLASVGTLEMSGSPLVEYRKHASNLSRDNLSKSLTYKARFDAEMDYSLEASAKVFAPSALYVLGRHIGLSINQLESIEVPLLLALVQLSHRNVSQVRRGFARLMELVGSKGEVDFLDEYGINSEKLDYYAQICDHMNTAAMARLEFRVGKLLR